MPKLNRRELHETSAAIFRAMGSAPEEAEEAAAHLARANLTGHDSHGIGMLPAYMRLFAEGKLVPNQTLRTVVDDGPILVLDADRGVGQRMAADAVRRGIERARELGACVLGLRNAAHIGRVGTYGELAASSGMIFVAFTNVATGPRLQAAHAGGDARIGTNPFVTAVPREAGPPVLLDMATTAIAAGKARVAMNMGKPVPENTLIDAAGRPTTDPSGLLQRHEGALLPFGGHKGGGLAFMCEVLGAVATGGFRADDPAGSGIVNSFLALVLDPGRLGMKNTALEAACAHLLASPVAPGYDKVRLPGDKETETYAVRDATGVEVDDTTWGDIVAGAQKLGLELRTAA